MKSLSHVRLFATLWTVAHQAPPSTGFSRQEYWSGVPLPSPGDLPDPRIKPRSPAFQADALTSEPPGKPKVDHTLSALLLSCWIFKNCFFVTKDIAGHFYFWATGLSESLEFQASCCLVSGGFTQLHILVRTDLNQVPESKADTNSCMQTWTVSGTTSQNRLLFLKKQCEKQCTFQAQSRGEFCCCYVPCLVDVCSVRLFA